MRRPALAAAVVLLGLPALAQEAGPARLLRQELSFGLVLRDNPGLALTETDPVLDFGTGLDLALVTSTPLDRLEFGLSGTLLARRDLADGAVSFRLDRPRAGLSYRREGAAAQFDATLRADRQRLSETDETESGAGWRDSLDLALALRDGAEDGPRVLRFELGALARRHGGGADLPDSLRGRAGLGAELRLDPMRRLEGTLSFARLARDGGARRDTGLLDLAFVVDRPDGSLRFALRHEATPEGDRQSLTAARRLQRAGAEWRLALGVAQGVSGDPELTGALGVILERPETRFEARLERTLGAGSEDTEQRVDRLEVSYDRALAEGFALTLDLSLRRREDRESGAESRLGSLALGLERAVTPDWTLGAELRHDLRDPSGAARAEATSLGLVLRRSLEHGF